MSTTAETPPAAATAVSLVAALLARPDEQRLREHKYRFSQAVVFGLPVIFLQYAGHRLGGLESDRWVGILQALLAGWVVYVGAGGMLFEGIILLMARRRLTGNLLAALVALGLYLFSAVSVLGVFATGMPWYRPLLFHIAVIVLAGWTGAAWARWSRRVSMG